MGKYDRFSTGVTPSVAIEVGYCEGCGGTVYDYEVNNCRACGAQIHNGCLEQCAVCRSDGCRACLSRDPETLDWKCEEDCSNG